MPHVTEWRYRQAGKDEDTYAKHKVYCCSTCNQPVSSAGHMQHGGYRYRPYAPGTYHKNTGWQTRGQDL